MRAILLATLALFPWTRQEGDPAAALLAADRAFCEATAEGGLDAWLGWFAPDAVVATPSGELRSGPAELRAYYASMGFPPARFHWEPTAAGLAEARDLGWSRGSWEIRAPAGPSGPEPVVAGGSYLTIWKKQPDGAYRVVTDSGGRDDVRTRLGEVGGPPLDWSCTTARFEAASSGELAFTLGRWTALTEEDEREGTLITVWRRAPDGAWEIETEIGFDH